jgi:hypothetical protein
MKTIHIAALVAGAGLLLSACASDGYYHHNHVAVSYDGYYDDAYGPFFDGYWGDDGGFYYTDAPGHPYRRDNANHFRHDAANGFHAVQGHAHDDHH